MNRRLPEITIRAMCRELLASAAKPSGRLLRRRLRERHGAAGNTVRIFAIWREESARAVSQRHQGGVSESGLEERLGSAQQDLMNARDRAERAELREQAHQDHWALEIDRLRQELKAQPQYAAELRRLQDQVLRLTAENAALREIVKTAG